MDSEQKQVLRSAINEEREHFEFPKIGPLEHSSWRRPFITVGIDSSTLL